MHSTSRNSKTGSLIREYYRVAIWRNSNEPFSTPNYGDAEIRSRLGTVHNLLQSTLKLGKLVFATTPRKESYLVANYYSYSKFDLIRDKVSIYPKLLESTGTYRSYISCHKADVAYAGLGRLVTGGSIDRYDGYFHLDITHDDIKSFDLVDDYYG